MIHVLVMGYDIRGAKINPAYVSEVPGFQVVAQAHSAIAARAGVSRKTAQRTWSARTGQYT
ncbi:hypothetical protein [Streptomyces sp. NPDC002187]|uniref:hypothetical protein n=1 Tax=Streptomyces sp. NPDC002187 TaxID=3364637 RepID=UPI0036BA88DD